MSLKGIGNVELDDSMLLATLEPMMHLLEDDKITEVMICPAGIGLWAVWYTYIDGDDYPTLDKFGGQIILTNAKLQQIISFMGGSNFQFTHEKRPVLECRIPQYGFRFTAVMSPASMDSHIFNIRKFKNQIITIDQYVESQTFSELQAKVFLDICAVEEYSTAICGTTGSGKTTLLLEPEKI